MKYFGKLFENLKMKKITKEQEKINTANQLAKAEKLQETLILSRSSSSTTTFSAKVDTYKLDVFKDSIEEYNTQNPEQKLKIGKVIENLMYDFYKEMKILNKKDEEQKDLFNEKGEE
jgi:hypothetical protein